MRQWFRVVLMGVSASALLGLLPNLISPAHANPPVNEIKLNSSNVQIVHVGLNNDVINMSLNVTSAGDSGDCEGGDDDLLETGVHVSVSVFTCEQYAFRQEGIDWQIWIQLGEFPLPRKLVIRTLTDDAKPQHSEVLTWNLAPSFSEDAFTFVPPAGVNRITIAEIKAGHSTGKK